MRLRNVHVKDEVLLRERIPQFLREERRYQAFQLRDERGQEFVVVQVPLADAEDGAPADETAEFKGRNEGGDRSSEDECVWYCGGVGCGPGAGGGGVLDAAIKCLFQIVCYEIRALQQQVHIIRRPTLHTIRRRYPRRILRRRPIQLRHHRTPQLCNPIAYRSVNVRPCGRGIGILLIIVCVAIFSREYPAIGVDVVRRTGAGRPRRGQEDAVCAEVSEEGRGEGDEPGFGGKGAVPAVC